MSTTIADALAGIAVQSEIEKWRNLAMRQAEVVQLMAVNVEEAHRMTRQAIDAARTRVTEDRKILEAAVVKLEARVTELLEANNAEVNRRRKFEAEANQEHAEKLLLRNECIRLRDAHSVLAGFIEGRVITLETIELPDPASEPPGTIVDGRPEAPCVPSEVAAAMDAVFPPAAKEGANN